MTNALPFQIGIGMTLGYWFCEYNFGKGEMVFIFAGGLAGIFLAYHYGD